MLTDLGIKKLPLPESRKEVPDGRISGLYLIVQPSGVKSWALRYRFAGQPKKLTIGAYPAIDLATARRLAQEAMGAVAGGKDPAAQKQAARASAKAEREANGDQIDRVIETFILRHAKPNTRGWQEVQRMLEKEVGEPWKGKRLSTITKADVHDLLDVIVDRGTPVRANRVFAQLRKMCSFATERGIIDKSPCSGVREPTQETPRDRVLDDNEVRLIWQACGAVGWPFAPFTQLLLLLGQRRGEVAGMRWSELDLDKGVWSLPGSRVKNHQDHDVPLPADAIEILKALPRVEVRNEKGGATKSLYVFTTNGRAPVSGFSKAKPNLDREILQRMRDEAEARGEDPATVKPLDAWTYHDCRRTVATNLQKLGIRLEVTEALLNHVGGSRAGVVGIYQRYSWDAEKRQALDGWARQLNEIVSGESASNVVELAAVRR